MHHSSLHIILQSYIPNPKLNTEEAKAIAIAKNWDRNNDFRTTKVRLSVNCDSCGGPRCIYSTHSIGSTNGPSQLQLTNLERSLENGYVCGHKIDTDRFYAMHHLRCGDYVESQYYMPDTGTKGGRIVTANCCSICFSHDSILSVCEIRNNRNLGGNIHLVVCRHCFDSNFEIPTSGGRANMKHKKQQEKSNKRKSMDIAVQNGRRKERKK